MKYTKEDLVRMSDELEKFADMDGTECGEYWHLLLALQRYPYMMSIPFQDAAERALVLAYEDAKEEFGNVEEEAPRDIEAENKKMRELLTKCLEIDDDAMLELDEDKHPPSYLRVEIEDVLGK